MENFNVTENTSKMYGKPSVFSEAFTDVQGKNNNLYSAEKDGFKKLLPQGFPELTIEGQLGNAPLKDFPDKKKVWLDDKEFDKNFANTRDDYSNKKGDYSEKKEALERLNKKADADLELKKDAELKQKKEDELVRQKKEGALDNGLKFDKTKNPGTDGGTKDSVNHQNSGKPAGLEGGPKDKPAPADQATRDSASERSHGGRHSTDKVAHDGGPKAKVWLDDNGTPSPDKIANADAGQKEKLFYGPEHIKPTPAPDKVVNQDGGEKYPTP